MSRIAGRAGIELSADPGFERRVRRLVVVSLVALGLVASLAAAGGAGLGIDLALAAGWVLMPCLLLLSLRLPPLRYGLALPASLVAAGLAAECLWHLPAAGPARAGWPLVLAGVLVGALLGGWFWFRWLPVPALLDQPFSPGRWALIAVHAGLVLAGLALVAVPVLA